MKETEQLKNLTESMGRIEESSPMTGELSQELYQALLNVHAAVDVNKTDEAVINFVHEIEEIYKKYSAHNV